MSNENIIKKFEEKLGSKDFISPSQLVACGLYGSSTAVRSALNKGAFPSIRISSHRTLIPRESVLEYLRKNVSVRG